MRSIILLLLVSTLIGCVRTTPPVPPAQAPDHHADRSNPWVLVDSRAKVMTVHRRGEPDLVLYGVAFGAAGVKQKQRQGDDVTPKGRYTVGWVSHSSKFVHFIGLNYPSLDDAARGRRNGIIDQKTFERIQAAHGAGKVPPQDTPLGGHIGIHGIGKGSLAIHRMANWTAGCIAVDNAQIRQLVSLVRPGVEFEIR